MTIEDEIRDTSKAFIAALLSNDGAAVAATLTDGWVYVASNGITPRADIVGAIASGRLIHLSFKTVGEERIAIHGGLALVTGRRSTTGTFDGTAYGTEEWRTDAYEKIGGRWLCVLSHRADAEV